MHSLDSGHGAPRPHPSPTGTTTQVPARPTRPSDGILSRLLTLAAAEGLTPQPGPRLTLRLARELGWKICGLDLSGLDEADAARIADTFAASLLAGLAADELADVDAYFGGVA